MVSFCSQNFCNYLKSVFFFRYLFIKIVFFVLFFWKKICGKLNKMKKIVCWFELCSTSHFSSAFSNVYIWKNEGVSIIEKLMGIERRITRKTLTTCDIECPKIDSSWKTAPITGGFITVYLYMLLRGVDVHLFHPNGQSRPEMWERHLAESTFGHCWRSQPRQCVIWYKNCPSWKHWWKIYSVLCPFEEHTTAGVFRKCTPESSCRSWWEKVW